MTRASACALLLCAAVLAVGVRFNTRAVGGSDSSCYALMAAAFGTGQWQPASALATRAPWPNATTAFAPGGFIPSPTRDGAASPICAPGFSLLLAPLYAIGGVDAIFWLTPCAGAALVWLTFVLGRRLAGEPCGIAAAVLIACAPVFLFQLVQPMNDVVTAALWTAVFVVMVTLSRSARQPESTVRRPAKSAQNSAWAFAPHALLGLLTSLAVLVRPNLAPAASVVALWCLRRGGAPVFALVGAALPAAVLLLVLQQVLYGHALRSGYGTMTDLFSHTHVITNLRHYAHALFTTQAAVPLVGLLVWPLLPAPLRAATLAPVLAAASIIITYLFYRPYPEWWYLRFLLPVLPLLTVLACVALASRVRHAAIVVGCAVAIAGFQLSTNATAQAFELQRLERRFRTVGIAARDRLPANSAYLSVWDSGSIRYFSQREVVLWEALPPSGLDTTVAWLTTQGLTPWLVLEEWEEPLFRERFALHSALGALDWPPRFVAERQVRAYRVADRALFLAGGRIDTEQLVTRSRR